MTVSLSSERFPPSGGFAGEGVRRLMGAPNLSLLQTVIRESLQNSCDAGSGRGPVRVVIGVRRLQAEQRVALQEMLAQLPQGSPATPQIAAVLQRDDPLVMEISDYGTVGLGGPTRADEAPPEGVRMDFVNFIRNVGAARDTDQGGGTYGYGKTALYLASSCGLILVDTLTGSAGSETRRLIGCQIGEAYADQGVRFTGRNWWGEAGDEGLVEPLTGEDAAGMAGRLGLPARPPGETGATIMILDPALGGEDESAADPEKLLLEIEEVVLWFFWPKMIDTGEGPAMTFALRGPDGERAVRSPSQVAPLDIFAEAYRKIRSGSADVRPVRSLRPNQLLGRLAIRRGFRTERIRFTTGEPLIPHTSRHIAVMRPVELVVRYYEGAALADARQEWAGVFICDDDPLVERAFADAEPPAHDDWIPENLPKGPGKTFVKVAIRELTNIAAAAGGQARPVAGAGAEGPSLARASESLARMLPLAGRSGGGGTGGGGGGSSGGGEGGGGSGSGGGRRGARIRIDAPVFAGLQAGPGGAEALFDIRAANPTAADARLVLRPGLVIDGVLTAEVSAPRGEVRLLGVSVGGGDEAPGSASPLLAAGDDTRIRVRLAVPAGAVVGLAATVGEAG